MHLLLEWNPGLKVPASALDVGRWALVPGALLVAWLSFRGRRFGGAWGSAWRGLLVTLLLFTPAWGYVADRASDWRHFDPRDAACRLDWGLVGVGGRYAFLNARCGHCRGWRKWRSDGCGARGERIVHGSFGSNARPHSGHAQLVRPRSE